MLRHKPFERLLAVAFLLGLQSAPAHSQVSALMKRQLAKASSQQYETRQVEGWNVLVNREFLRQQPALAERTLALLHFQLYQIVRRVPAGAVEKLRNLRIWVEENSPTSTCMAYHPDPKWLESHGGNPAKGRCIELANARKFLDWTLSQPWMLLHEMSHGYHHQFLEGGFDNPRIKAAYERAMKAKTYEKVLYINGRERKAYACNNPMEYFAEATEGFFGTNDYYPFVNAELKRHDPGAYALLEKLWGVGPARTSEKAAQRPRSTRKGSKVSET